MASSSASAAFVPPDIDDLKERLYSACISHQDTTFDQNEMFEFGIIQDRNVLLLLKVCQALVDARLFRLLNRDGTTVWQARPREEANKYKGLNAEQAIVYSIIDDAGAEGMWTKTIKARSNLADTSLTAVFKHLLHKKLIADMKSVAYPQRKMYIKASVRPSDTASGGPFYTDGELDDAFIEAIADALYNYIFSRSFYQSSTGRSRKPMKKPTSRKSMGEAQAYREGADEVAIKLEDEPSEQQIKQQRLDAMYPMPAGYQKYPTLRDLATFIDKAGITNTVLGLEDIQQLLDVLVWDNRIEAVLAGPDGVSYRALRMTADEMEDGPTNGLTQAPCGNCPVFDICEEGGPVAPSNCEYFKRWLDPDGY